MFKIVQRISNNSFIKSIFMLLSGSGIGHLITLLSLPLLARFFSPEEFSLLAVYVSIIAIFSSVACLRYEIAIPIAKSKQSALSLLSVSLICSLSISSLVAIITLLFSSDITRLTQLQSGTLIFVPLGIFFASLFNALQYWFTREKSFGMIAKTRVTQSVLGNGTQLVGGVFSNPLGLVIGHFFYCTAGVINFSVRLIRENIYALKKLRWKRTKAIAVKYREYPFFSSPEVIANNIGSQLPIITIAAATSAEAGFLLLAIKTMQAPMALIGSSVAQVFYSNVAQIKKKTARKELAQSTLLGLIKVGVGPIICIAIIAKPLFLFVFGSDWLRAGELVSWCVLWFIFQFLASPISMIMFVEKKQKVMLALTVFGGVIRFSSVVLALQFYDSHVSEMFAISSGVFYFTCLLTFLYFASFKISDLVKLFMKALPFTIFWSTLGFVTSYLFKYIL